LEKLDVEKLILDNKFLRFKITEFESAIVEAKDNERINIELEEQLQLNRRFHTLHLEYFNSIETLAEHRRVNESRELKAHDLPIQLSSLEKKINNPQYKETKPLLEDTLNLLQAEMTKLSKEQAESIQIIEQLKKITHSNRQLLQILSERLGSLTPGDRGAIDETENMFKLFKRLNKKE